MKISIEGCTVRPAGEADAAACDRLCAAVHGHTRSGEVADAIREGDARVVERDGRVVGYTTGLGYFGHSVAECNRDLMALIGAAEGFGGPGLLVLLATRRCFAGAWKTDCGLCSPAP